MGFSIGEKKSELLQRTEQKCRLNEENGRASSTGDGSKTYTEFMAVISKDLKQHLMFP